MGLWVWFPTQAKAPSVNSAVIVTRPGSTQRLDPSTLLKRVAQSNVVYLGETHDRPEDHAAQLEILQALLRLRPRLVIGMEMFQKPYQGAIDGYLTGNLTEAELQAQSQYAQRWGFPWEFYAPIMRFAKERQLPVLALNTPREVTRKAARTGLESLTTEERQSIPPLQEIVVGPDRYRDRLRQIYTTGHQGKGNNQGFDRFFQAQVLWDETMAERIAQSLRQNPKALVVVLVGQGHLLYGEGIPDRVKRRIPTVTQFSVLLNPALELRQEQKVADYFWDSVGSK
ncbi:MAG TPA: ChaN family lipoprotein [Thermosynechococcaceae cyanobacterium]